MTISVSIHADPEQRVIDAARKRMLSTLRRMQEHAGRGTFDPTYLRARDDHHAATWALDALITAHTALLLGQEVRDVERTVEREWELHRARLCEAECEFDHDSRA